MLTEGNLVNAGGSDPLMTTIVAMDPIYVYFAVDERALLRYRERNPRPRADQLKPLEESQIPFEFGLETDEGFPRKGILDFADNRIDAATGTIQVRGKADNPEGDLHSRRTRAGARRRQRSVPGPARSRHGHPDRSGQEVRALPEREERRRAPRHSPRQAAARRHARCSSQRRRPMRACGAEDRVDRAGAAARPRELPGRADGRATGKAAGEGATA